MSNPWGDLFPDQPLAVIALETIDAEVARRSQNQTGSWTPEPIIYVPPPPADSTL